MREQRQTIIAVSLGVAAFLAASDIAWNTYHRRFEAYTPGSHVAPVETAAQLSNFQSRVLADLNRQCAANIEYRDGYFSGGSPPPKIGVCTDVVIRSYQAAGVDLRRAVADDIRQNPSAYHMDRPDPNIDYRRCRNLTVFFRRHAQTLPASGPNADWEPGDIVFWDTRGDGHVDHVGVIANHIGADGNPTVTHHWPGHVVTEMDWLYRLPTLSHYRWKSTSGRSQV